MSSNHLKTMKHHILTFQSVILASAGILLAAITTPAGVLGTAGTYGALAYSTVTSTGNSVITGDIGVSPGTSIIGFYRTDGGVGVVTGNVNQGNAAAATAIADLATAYSTLTALGSGTHINLTGQDLGSLPGALTPGVYVFNTSAQLTGTLTLDAQNNQMRGSYSSSAARLPRPSARP